MAILLSALPTLAAGKGRAGNMMKGKIFMVEIKFKGNTPLEALSSLTAFGMHCMKNSDVCGAARRILEAEKREEQKQSSAQPETPPAAANSDPKPIREADPASDTPKDAPAPTAAPGPADGESGQTPAPGDKRSPVPTVEQVRAKGIEASRKYGKETVVAILQKFGAPGLSTVAEKDRAAFLKELEKLGEKDA